MASAKFGSPSAVLGRAGCDAIGSHRPSVPQYRATSSPPLQVDPGKRHGFERRKGALLAYRCYARCRGWLLNRLLGCPSMSLALTLPARLDRYHKPREKRIQRGQPTLSRVHTQNLDL